MRPESPADDPDLTLEERLVYLRGLYIAAISIIQDLRAENAELRKLYEETMR